MCSGASDEPRADQLVADTARNGRTLRLRRRLSADESRRRTDEHRLWRSTLEFGGRTLHRQVPTSRDRWRTGRTFPGKPLSRKDVSRNDACCEMSRRRRHDRPLRRCHCCRMLDQLEAAVVVDAALVVVAWWSAVDQHHHLRGSRCRDHARVADVAALRSLHFGCELVQRPTTVPATLWRCRDISWHNDNFWWILG